MIFKLFILLYSTLLQPLSAQQCNYAASVSTFAATISDSPQSIERLVTVSRPTNSSVANCQNYRVYFGMGQGNSYQRVASTWNGNLNYNLYSDANLSKVLKDYGDAGPGEFLEGSVPQPNTPQSLSFYVGLPQIQDIFNHPPGVYTDVVPIHVYAVRQNGNIELQTTRYLTVHIILPRFAQLSLIPENAPFDPGSTTHTINFGNMFTGQEMGADLRVRGNVGFGVLMSSQNGSQLRRGSQYVSYQIRINQGPYFSLFPAGNLFQVATSHQRTNLDGKRFNIKAKLGAIATNLESGLYQDVITITVMAW